MKNYNLGMKYSYSIARGRTGPCCGIILPQPQLHLDHKHSSSQF